jgi:hypothetical protein
MREYKKAEGVPNVNHAGFRGALGEMAIDSTEERFNSLPLPRLSSDVSHHVILRDEAEEDDCLDFVEIF